MGYSGRYHAASLAAVFLALAIGILIGVGPRAQRRLRRRTKDLEQSLKSDLASARGQRSTTSRAQLNQRAASSASRSIPALVGQPAARRADRAWSRSAALARRHQGRHRGRRRAPTARPAAGLARGRRGARAARPARRSRPTRRARRGPQVARDPDDARPPSRGASGASLVVGGPTFDALSRRAAEPSQRASPGGIDGVIVVRHRPTDLGSRQSRGGRRRSRRGS